MFAMLARAAVYHFCESRSSKSTRLFALIHRHRTSDSICKAAPGCPKYEADGSAWGAGGACFGHFAPMACKVMLM